MYWNNPPEREDGDDHDETNEAVPKQRKWLRREVSKRTHLDPLYGMLADLELAGSPFFLGMDYDDDRDDIDEAGPF